jgi:hypothetical protein
MTARVERHCERRGTSREAIQRPFRVVSLDCFASLAMTTWLKVESGEWKVENGGKRSGASQNSQ